MPLVTIMAIVLIALQLGQGAHAQLLLPETECSTMVKEVLKARLGQIALVVQRESGGKSRLLISSGAGAFPSIGIIV